ncbi:extracellular solute-binding protein [Candidatus Acetothermia bacterium]|jgi:multiple sugar transport system substrate-binding protein|nr:extracellular solute-binding protein [Candidatus Acetothermia bacterium]MCI2426916.1 extracellular solute-binding protein [Candidatus Acetothermia bacterium]
MFKRLLTLTLLIVLVSGVALFAVEDRLVIAVPWAGAELEAFLPVLQAFTDETGIEVTPITLRFEDLAVFLPAQFAAGITVADVIFMWSWFIEEKARAGHVLAITEVIDPADLLVGALDPVTIDNQLYGIAYTGKVKPGFWYRLSFFEKHGLTVPGTWEEFVALLEEIAQIPGIVAPIASGNGVGWPLSDIAEHFLIAFGGPELFKALVAGEIAWTDPTVEAIFADKLVPLLKAGHFGEPTEWTMAKELWWGGDYGLYFMGSWITGMVEDPENLGLFTLPGTEGMVFAIDYAFIPIYTERPAAAKKLISFLATRGQVIQVGKGGHLATYINVPLEAYPPVDARVAELLVGMVVLPDLDDTIGGAFQLAFWDQLKLLWVAPEMLPEVLGILEELAP